jgi:hypothetical protein
MRGEGGSWIAYFAAYARYCVAEVYATIPNDIFTATTDGLISSLSAAAQALIETVCVGAPPVPPPPTPTPNPYPGNVPPFSVSTPLPTIAVPSTTPVPGTVGVVLTADVSDTTPHPYEDVTVTATLKNDGQPVSYQPMTAVWHFAGGVDRTCSAVTDLLGQAGCTLNIENAPVGVNVPVDVTVTYGGQSYQAETSFTPQI